MIHAFGKSAEDWRIGITRIIRQLIPVVDSGRVKQRSERDQRKPGGSPALRLAPLLFNSWFRRMEADVRLALLATREDPGEKMKSGRHALCLITAIALAVVFSLTAAHNLLAQGGTGSLRGQVVDPVGRRRGERSGTGDDIQRTNADDDNKRSWGVRAGEFGARRLHCGTQRQRLCPIQEGSCANRAPARSSSSTSRSRCKANKSKLRFPEKP